GVYARLRPTIGGSNCFSTAMPRNAGRSARFYGNDASARCDPQPIGRKAMNRFNTLVVAGALLAVPMSNAVAGPCTTEIENVTKLMAARDAGAGPTTGAGGAAGQQPADRPAQHPPTEIIGRQTQGKGASPQDAQSQTRGGP